MLLSLDGRPFQLCLILYETERVNCTELGRSTLKRDPSCDLVFIFRWSTKSSWYLNLIYINKFWRKKSCHALYDDYRIQHTVVILIWKLVKGNNVAPVTFITFSKVSYIRLTKWMLFGHHPSWSRVNSASKSSPHNPQLCLEINGVQSGPSKAFCLRDIKHLSKLMRWCSLEITIINYQRPKNKETSYEGTFNRMPRRGVEPHLIQKARPKNITILSTIQRRLRTVKCTSLAGIWETRDEYVCHWWKWALDARGDG